MDVNRTHIVRRTRLGDPVVVPAFVVFGTLLLVLGLGAAVGWLAARGRSAAPAPVIVEKTVEKRCPAPEPAPASAAAPAAVPAAKAPARPVRVRVAHVSRTAFAGGEGWEPARM
jgi:hypothetical protein